MRPYLFALLVCAGCDEGPAGGSEYYDRVIQPILTASCVRQQGGCHKDDGTGNALGNLDLTSYDRITKRRDVLRTYGSFPIPLLLLKAVGKDAPPIPYQDSSGKTVFLDSEIEHVGGANVSVDSNAYFELSQWMANGAQRNGSVVVRPRQMGTGACNPDFARVRPDVAAQINTVDTASPAFAKFRDKVAPVIRTSCA